MYIQYTYNYVRYIHLNALFEMVLPLKLLIILENMLVQTCAWPHVYVQLRGRTTQNMLCSAAATIFMKIWKFWPSADKISMSNIKSCTLLTWYSTVAYVQYKINEICGILGLNWILHTLTYKQLKVLSRWPTIGWNKLALVLNFFHVFTLGLGHCFIYNH